MLDETRIKTLPGFESSAKHLKKLDITASEEMLEGVRNVHSKQFGTKLTTKEVKEWLDEAKEKTVKVIDENWDKVTALAKLLQDKEIVNESELLELVGY